LLSKLPWQPLYTIYRSGQAEVTVHGLVSIVDSKGQAIASVGDTSTFLWTRSLLKPCQLLGHLDLVKNSYPDLTTAHLALMLSSQDGEPFHIELLNEIITTGGVTESALKCPASFPMSDISKCQVVTSDQSASAKFNGCSGKHLGFILAAKASGRSIDDYLNPDGIQFNSLKEILAWMLDRDSSQFASTTDGCLMPNYGCTAHEIAWMYAQLVSPLDKLGHSAPPESIESCIKNWHEPKALMVKHPEVVGGSRRLDTRIMSGQLFDANAAVVAKEGAEGLLGLGFAPAEYFPDGLGILVKIASGCNSKQLETAIREVMRQLGLKVKNEESEASHLSTEFHFNLKTAVKS
jgi:L-asparaginase II